MSDEFKAWFNGQLRPFNECTVNIRTHALHYGSSVFEGIRAYRTHQGTRIFRLSDHLKRFFWSAEVYRMPIPYSFDELHAACRQTVQENALESAYLRPIAFRGDVGLGLMPGELSAIETAVIVADWGTYLGEGVLDRGVEVCVSSWQRVAPNTIPAGAKAGGNYLSSFLIVSEARERGFTEGIAMGTDGLVSEGSGENVFVVSDGRILTPPVAASILSGITRDTAIKLARDLGMTVEEQSISREQLYAAEEIFMTGTAVEITPVRKVDHMLIGNGGRGPVTEQLQQAFFGLFDGRTSDSRGWLEPL
ncbi:MAG: branched-chain amino acid transaminase [Xanthomonadales bacterium]|nr:branched-chain amino acid transaminase [Xanthomonadales bacterium]